MAQLAVALTNQPQRAGFPLTQLPKPAGVKISQIRTLSGQRIGRRLGTDLPEETAQVIEALHEILSA